MGNVLSVENNVNAIKIFQITCSACSIEHNEQNLKISFLTKFPLQIF